MNRNTLRIAGGMSILTALGFCVRIGISVIAQEPEPVGIIGGADTPTVLYLVSRFWWIGSIVAILLVFGIICIAVSKKK